MKIEIVISLLIALYLSLDRKIIIAIPFYFYAISRYMVPNVSQVWLIGISILLWGLLMWRQGKVTERFTTAADAATKKEEVKEETYEEIEKEIKTLEGFKMSPHEAQSMTHDLVKTFQQLKGLVNEMTPALKEMKQITEMFSDMNKK